MSAPRETSRIEPNHNKTTKALALSVEQDDIETNLESLNQSLETDISKKKFKTIPGISKWFKWSWPVKDQFAGFICTCSLLHIDVWTEFRPKQALKENIKFGNKGNLRIKDCYSPEDMHANLEALVANEKLTVEEIPTVKTIKGWIGRYSAYFKKEASEKALLK
ncbi:44017_t:CDS:2, partial [Gigaspora margarita]